MNVLTVFYSRFQFLTDYYYTAPTDLTRKFLRKYSNKPVYSYEHTFDSPYALHKQLGQSLNGTMAHFDSRGTFSTDFAGTCVKPSIERFSKEEFHVVTGTAHFDDVQYVFYMKMFREPKDPNDPVNRFRKMVSAMWADFAKYG